MSVRVSKAQYETQEEFAGLVLRHRTEGVYGRAALAMRRGMCDVLIDPRGLLLSVYTPSELGTVIGGIVDLNVADWEAHTRYIGAWLPLVCLKQAPTQRELTPMHITAEP